jgi:hypothetical protein
VKDPERRRVQELLAWLLEFHWREAKPVFGRMFDRHEMTEQELVEDLDCLGGLQRTGTPREPDKRSWLSEYSFDADQDTTLHEESKCFFAHDLAVRTIIWSFDADDGRLRIRLGPSAPKPPDRLSLIPNEYVSAKPPQSPPEATNQLFCLSSLLLPKGRSMIDARNRMTPGPGYSLQLRRPDHGAGTGPDHLR